jgi:hypothetical protein
LLKSDIEDKLNLTPTVQKQGEKNETLKMPFILGIRLSALHLFSQNGLEKAQAELDLLRVVFLREKDP